MARQGKRTLPLPCRPTPEGQARGQGRLRRRRGRPRRRLLRGADDRGQRLLAALDLDLRSYAALAGTALASFRASSMALATPSLRATVFTRARSTPLSLFRAARYCPCRLRAARARA